MNFKLAIILYATTSVNWKQRHAQKCNNKFSSILALLYLLLGLGVHLELPLEQVHRGEAGRVLLAGQPLVVRVGGAVVQDALVAGYGQLCEPHL